MKDYIKNLALLCLGDQDTFQTKTTTGFRCDCSTAIYNNRVFIEKNFGSSDLTHAENYHSPNPCTFWVDSEDSTAKKIFSEDNYSFCISFPVMLLDLQNFKQTGIDRNITIRRLKSESEILDLMLPLIIKEYNPQINDIDFNKYLKDWHILFNYLRHSTAYGYMHFFLGYWGNIPAATGIFIIKEDAVYIHWIGSLLEFRRKGLGFAITSMPLCGFKKSGIKRAYLFTSAMGQPLYEKIGFTMTERIDVYKNKIINDGSIKT